MNGFGQWNERGHAHLAWGRRLHKSQRLTGPFRCPTTVSLYVAWALSKEIMSQMSQKRKRGAKDWWKMKINLWRFKPLEFGGHLFHRKMQPILMPYQKILPQQWTRPLQASTPGKSQEGHHQARLQRDSVLKKMVGNCRRHWAFKMETVQVRNLNLIPPCVTLASSHILWASVSSAIKWG